MNALGSVGFRIFILQYLPKDTLKDGKIGFTTKPQLTFEHHKTNNNNFRTL